MYGPQALTEQALIEQTLERLPDHVVLMGASTSVCFLWHSLPCLCLLHEYSPPFLKPSTFLPLAIIV